MTENQKSLLRKLVSAALVATVITALVLIFNRHDYDFIPIENPDISQLVPAPPLIEGRTITQEIEISPPLAEGTFALGLTFGTYMRVNEAKFSVSLSQDGFKQSHTVKSKTLDDNKERQFAFSGFEAGPAELALSGKNGDETNSPTVWLAPATNFPPVKIDGELQPQQVLVRRYYGLDKPVIGDFSYQWFVVVFVLVVLLFEIPFVRNQTISKKAVR